MQTPTTSRTVTTTKNRSASARLQTFLIVSLLFALSTLCLSHYKVVHSVPDHHDRVTVPLPRNQAAAKGGLPPVPDFVKRKAIQTQENTVQGLVTFRTPQEAVGVDAKVLLRPTMGVHRPSSNAVFAFAEGYDLKVYVTFIESLKQTGFVGDVVLAVSETKKMKPSVLDYLKWYTERDEKSLRIVGYALDWQCLTKNGDKIKGSQRGSTVNHGFSDCKLDGMWTNRDGTPAEDPREARPVATARYELYYIWSKQYHERSKILVIDSRDTYFQAPFSFESSAAPKLRGAHLPDNVSDSCRLDLFEENREAVDIGKSKYNSRWIKSAYGQATLKKMESKPVICSGSTMGSQAAIEHYSSAMVAQFDKTKCKAVGCDQGMHNYLYYEGGLESWLQSKGCSTHVHEQGSGAVNNLAALRQTSLRDQGILKVQDGSGSDDIFVANNDGKASPILHQYDRDDELKKTIQKRATMLLKGWKVGVEASTNSLSSQRFNKMKTISK